MQPSLLGAVNLNPLKLGSVIANVASIASFAFYIAERTSSLPHPPGMSSLNVVIQLSIVSAIAYGILWAIADGLLFGGRFRAGGSGNLPVGLSAVVLSLSVTVPLVCVPFVYQVMTGIRVLMPSHWKAAFLLILLGAVSHILMYGTTTFPPNGLRQKLVPSGEHASLTRTLSMEIVLAAVHFGLIVLPYRLVVDPGGQLLETVLGRTLLPGLVYFLGITVFIVLEYPDSLNKPTALEVRGIISGLLIMFCFCGGMFL